MPPYLWLFAIVLRPGLKLNNTLILPSSAIRQSGKSCFPFQEQPKFFCRVSAALQRSSSGGRSWQAFGECKKSLHFLGRAGICLFKTVVFVRIDYQNCNDLNLNLDKTMLSSNLNLKKSFRKHINREKI